MKLENAGRDNALTEIQARKILSEIYTIRNQGEQLPGSKAREFFKSWGPHRSRTTNALQRAGQT